MERLKELRKKHNYSCKDMANMLGICKSYYWQLENGSKNLYYKMAERIAELFKVDPDDIFLSKTINNDAKEKIDVFITFSKNIVFPEVHKSLELKFDNSLQNLSSNNYKEVKTNIHLLDFYIEALMDLQIINKDMFINLIEKLAAINDLIN